jgi:fructokinase
VNASSNLYAGVELGGTKCIAILARNPNDILARESVSTTTPDETLGRVEKVLAEWHSGEALASVGIASFGPLDLDPGSSTFGSIARTPKPGWTGADVRGRLSRAAAVPVAFDTDVNGAALAEMRWGSGVGLDDFAYITVGTGVGVGLIVNGQPTRGFGHCELGHIRVPRLPGDDFEGSCPFHRDCVEGLTAGPSLEARAGKKDLDHLSVDDPIWTAVAWALAQLCQTIVCAAAPRAIAMGGGVLDRQPHLLERVNCLLLESLNGYIQIPTNDPYVRPPALGKNAGPMGAIALAMTVRA